MFSFQRFPVYLEAKGFYKTISITIISNQFIDFDTRDQLRRAAKSIILNIAEGAGKYSKPDKKRYYAIARGSLNECVSIIETIELDNKISQNFVVDCTKISNL